LEALARRARAGTVVAGAFYADGDTVLRFSAQIVDVLHHNVVWVIPPVVVPVGSEVRALEELTQRATGAVAALLDPRFSSWFHSATAPPRFDAFQEFVRGVDLQIRTDAKRALVHYNRAIMLDSTFTWARMQAAVAHMNEFQNAIADSIMDVVDRMRDRVTPLQRHWLDWMLATRKEDWVEAYRAMQKAATLAPERFLYSLGNDASSINRPRASLAALQKLGPESPYIGGSIMYWDIVTGSLHQLGKYHEELAAAKKAQRFHPDRIAAMGFEIRALAALKRVPALLSRLEAVVVFTREAARNVDQPDLIGITPASIMINAARELRAHENEKAALAALEQAIDWHRARPAEEARRPERRTELGNALYLARQWDAARLVFQQLTTEDPDNLICIGFLGAIAARRHDRGTAQRMMAILEERKRSQPRPNMQASYWQAKIAAVLEDRKSAVQHLVDLLGEPGRYVHADLDLELLAGYPPFEELRKPKD
ncbi:MAG: hypothetical protein ACRENP_28420, partial [Longimicrobiales bacterium]